MKSPEDTKPESWHRVFGAGANNAAWAPAELPAGEVNHRELLDAAHAATWHWQQIGPLPLKKTATSSNASSGMFLPFEQEPGVKS